MASGSGVGESGSTLPAAILPIEASADFGHGGPSAGPCHAPVLPGHGGKPDQKHPCSGTQNEIGEFPDHCSGPDDSELSDPDFGIGAQMFHATVPRRNWGTNAAK